MSDQNVQFVNTQLLARAKAGLEANNIETVIVQGRDEVVPQLKKMLTDGQTVSNGGSATLVECGVNAFLREGPYSYLDRDAPGIDKKQVQRAAFSADVYLASANAVTEAGEIFEIDGMGNRVAALAYGPDRVIFVAGRNKIVADLDAARQRRRRMAAPANCRRLGLSTPCAQTGLCSDCKSADRVCCIELVLSFQRQKDKYKMILVDEELGF